MSLFDFISLVRFLKRFDVRRRKPVAQPVPDVNADDVERVVRREFPAGQFATVTGLLSKYATARGRHGPARVQLAALKLANGSVEKLRGHLAWPDYRDLLASAEYPYYHRMGLKVREMSADDKGHIFDSDWQQYEAWLRK